MSASEAKLHKVQLTEAKATLLITLYAKALDSRSDRSILHDDKANAMVGAIDYDFEKLNGPGNGNIMVVRAKQMDDWIHGFLKTNPDAIVLNLGCGLDTRISRIKPARKVSWFDVDYPEVIELRKRFFSDSENYRMIASSVTEAGWLPSIPNDRPAMIIAEGLLEYLSEGDVRALFGRLTKHFTHGQMVFDVMNSFAIKSGKAKLKETTGAEHKWAVDDVREVDRMNPGFQRVDDLSVFRAGGVKSLPLKPRLIYRALALVPAFRNMLRLLRYRF
ncbi:MAG: class I SAM-dependent methyltransferase [Fibrobacteres bacterium]|jgi:O-methyltransferase involved in polyketide biosynthesis|nr:class I SAM-dependent methyltransferase [Fibrobacterota bacterium]